MTHSASRRQEIGHRIGAVIRVARHECGWSQRELATRVGASKSSVQRLEAGDAAYADMRLLGAAFDTLGIRVSFDTGTLGLAGRREQRDGVHASCLGYASRRLRAQGWSVRTEVEIGWGRFRGWIDLLAYRAADRRLICAEVKTELDDVGRLQRTIAWYTREAPDAARRLGWHPRQTVPVLLILETADNDARIRRNRGLLRETFPGTARELGAWSLSPGGPAPPAAMAMIDPRSRRATWLIPTTSEGRRSLAPYADYREAAAVIVSSPAVSATHR